MALTRQRSQLLFLHQLGSSLPNSRDPAVGIVKQHFERPAPPGPHLTLKTGPAVWTFQGSPWLSRRSRCPCREPGVLWPATPSHQACPPAVPSETTQGPPRRAACRRARRRRRRATSRVLSFRESGRKPISTFVRCCASNVLYDPRDRILDQPGSGARPADQISTTATLPPDGDPST